MAKGPLDRVGLSANYLLVLSANYLNDLLKKIQIEHNHI